MKKIITACLTLSLCACAKSQTALDTLKSDINNAFVLVNGNPDTVSTHTLNQTFKKIIFYSGKNSLSKDFRFSDSEEELYVQGLENIFDEYARTNNLKKQITFSKLSKSEKNSLGKEKWIRYADSLDNCRVLYKWQKKIKYIELDIYSPVKLGTYTATVPPATTTIKLNGKDVVVATANLERKNKRSGVMILYFGSNRIVSNVSLFVVEIDKNNSEDGIAESLQRRVAGSSPYMYYEFKEGFDCSNAQGYLRKKGISPPSCTY